MKPQSFRPGWFAYPHTGIATIVLSKEELAEQEAVMGNSEYIRAVTKGELAYQTSGIPAMVAQYHSILSGAPIESAERTNNGLAS